jgi:hypothetical protein
MTDNAMGKRKTNSDLVYVVCVCLQKKTNNTICVGHHHKKTNKNNENKIIVCPFFFSTLTYLSLIDLRLYATPLVAITLFFYTIQI